MVKKIKVLIVDDSKTIRALIKHAFQKCPELEVCGEAANPMEARDIIVKDQPDVITLDVEMPGMNGLQFLDKIMRLRPIPVVMVSSLTERGANIAIKALQMGAFDCFPKGQGATGADAFAGLARIVVQAAHSKPGSQSIRREMSGQVGGRISANGTGNWRHMFDVVAIGSSTGGVEAVEDVLRNLPQSSPPIVICQHMPRLFTASFASRLNQIIPQFGIEEAKDGEVMRPGMVRIAPGGDMHLVVDKTGGGICTRFFKAPPVSGHVPSVDVLFTSVAENIGRNALGIILTGMGRDGAEGLLSMRRIGCRTIAQDRQSAVVYGMPRVAAEIGAAEQICSLKQIPYTAMTML